MDFLKGKNILVTGATGLVGTNTLLRLKAIREANMRAIYHKKEPRVFSENISYIKADLTKLDECKKVVQGIDYVMMFAAKIVRRPADLGYLIENLNMNFQMLEAAYHAGVKKFLWLSSATAYPPSCAPLKEDEMFRADPPDESFPLGWATRYTEVLCRMYAMKLKNSMTVIVLRPTAIYGEYGDFDLSTCHVLPAIIRKVVERQESIEIWGNGEVARDFVYVGDVIEACFLALMKVQGFADFNIGLGKSYNTKEILRMVLEAENYSGARIIFNETKQSKSYPIFINRDKARDILGFEPKTSIKEGIAKTINWYRANLMADIREEK